MPRRNTSHARSFLGEVVFLAGTPIRLSCQLINASEGDFDLDIREARLLGLFTLPTAIAVTPLAALVGGVKAVTAVLCAHHVEEEEVEPDFPHLRSSVSSTGFIMELIGLGQRSEAAAFDGDEPGLEEAAPAPAPQRVILPRPEGQYQRAAAYTA